MYVCMFVCLYVCMYISGTVESPVELEFASVIVILEEFCDFFRDVQRSHLKIRILLRIRKKRNWSDTRNNKVWACYISAADFLVSLWTRSSEKFRERRFSGNPLTYIYGIIIEYIILFSQAICQLLMKYSVKPNKLHSYLAAFICTFLSDQWCGKIELTRLMQNSLAYKATALNQICT